MSTKVSTEEHSPHRLTPARIRVTASSLPGSLSAAAVAESTQSERCHPLHHVPTSTPTALQPSPRRSTVPLECPPHRLLPVEVCAGALCLEDFWTIHGFGVSAALLRRECQASHCQHGKQRPRPLPFPSRTCHLVQVPLQASLRACTGSPGGHPEGGRLEGSTGCSGSHR